MNWDLMLFLIAVCVFAIVPTIPIVVILGWRQLNKRRPEVRSQELIAGSVSTPAERKQRWVLLSF